MRKVKHMLLVAGCLFLSACTEDALYQDYGEGTGTLVISGLEVETVVGDIQTKASMMEEDIPGVEEFKIELIDTETQSVVKELELGVNKELSAGAYTVRASYGEEGIMSYTPYFMGEKEVTIENGATRSVSLKPSLQNAVLHPKMDEALIAQYDNYALNIKKDDGEPISLTNDKDFFLPIGEGTYTLTLFGENKLGEMVSHAWEYQGSQFVAKTRYIVNCNPDLPSFTLPEQAETNAWSKFIYVTPMTAENFTHIPEGMTADEILAKMVYEASDDGQTWIPAIMDGDKVVITGLEPSSTDPDSPPKQYTVRARYGGVNSDNTATLTMENAQELENGDMDSWDKDEYTTYGKRKIYLYYVGESSSDKYWGTRNSLTMDGVEGGDSNGTSNQITAYRWNSCTIETDDAVSGSAAEIRTMALTQASVSGTEVGSGLFWANNEVEDFVYRNHRVFSGWLYTGSTDVTVSNEIPDELGVSHIARPISLSFDYKYAPYNGDKCSIYAKLYGKEGNEIASVNFETDAVQDSYETIDLVFEYRDLQVEAAYIYIMFKSGVNESWNYVQYISGSYNANPWSLDTFVGSVLKIDNVVLNYDYE